MTNPSPRPLRPEPLRSTCGQAVRETACFDYIQAAHLSVLWLLDPDNPYALASMADNEYRQGRYFEARAFTERRLAAAPANATVLQLAADVEEKLGDKAAASRYVQRLRAEFPDVVTADPWGK